MFPWEAAPPAPPRSGRRATAPRAAAVGAGDCLIHLPRAVAAAAAAAPSAAAAAPSAAAPCCELVLDAKRALGEGALWDAARQRLLWVDIVRCKVFVYDPAGGTNRALDVRQMVGTVVPRAPPRQHELVVAAHRGVMAIDAATGAVTEFLGNPPAEQAAPGNRWNDGKCDPAGRLWAGTMGLFCEAGAGALYSLDTDVAHTFTAVVEGATCPNGIVWTADGATMYWIDTMAGGVFAFDFDARSGAATNRRLAFAIEGEGAGYPDGCTIDADDNLWIAMWGGGAVRRYDPRAGALLGVYAVPASQVTSCAFGGAELDQLYVTTARCGLDDAALERHPAAGGLFKFDFAGTGVRGVPAVPFKG